MNSNAYKQPIPQWKDAASHERNAPAPQPFGAGEWEAGYLLPQLANPAPLPL